jgi:hypothetical protein
MVLAAAVSGGACGVRAQSIYWSFNSDMPTSNDVADVSAGALSRGNGGTAEMLTSTSASSGYTGASGGTNAVASAGGGVLITNGSTYFQFTLTPAQGTVLSLTNLLFGSRSTSTGPAAFCLRSSVDSFASDLAVGMLQANSAWELKRAVPSFRSAFEGVPVTFRIYGYSGTGGSSNWRIDDVSLGVEAVTSGAPGPLPAPVAEGATGVGAECFTAKWSAVQGAAGYYLDVYAFAGVPPTRVREGFDSYPAVTPPGWEIVTGGGVYTTTGNYGIESPSVKLEAEGHSLTTAVYPAAVTNFSFWSRGQSASNSTVRVEGHDGAAWDTLDIVSVTNASTQKSYLLDAAAGYTRFRLTYGKDKGNLAVDDVSAAYGNTSVVFVLTNQAVGEATSYALNHLVPGVYFYRVRAVAEARVSADSNVISVDTAASPTPPVVGTVLPQVTRVGETLQFALTVTPTQSDSVTSTNVTASVGVTGPWALSGGQFRFTPASGDVGERVFTFTATDKDGVSDAMAATVTVRRVQVNAVRMTAPTGSYMQDFNALATNGDANVWDNAAEPLEAWYANAGASAVTIYRAGAGTGTSGGLYAYGEGGSGDRSLGSLASSGNDLFYGIALTNESAQTWTILSVRFMAEQWRVSASALTNTLAFDVCVTNRVLPLTQGVWQRVDALCFDSPVVTNASQSAGAVYASALRTATVAGPVAPGAVVLLRWSDPDDAGLDHGFAIDDLRVMWSAGSGGTRMLVK